LDSRFVPSLQHVAIELSETNFEANEYCSDEDEINDYYMTSSKETFYGMRVYDQIDPSQQSHYFQNITDHKPKFIQKQTAGCLLTISKTCFSADK
jgi:hypothetical protein